jgi:hypothetical protein
MNGAKDRKMAVVHLSAELAAPKQKTEIALSVFFQWIRFESFDGVEFVYEAVYPTKEIHAAPGDRSERGEEEEMGLPANEVFSPVLDYGPLLEPDLDADFAENLSLSATPTTIAFAENQDGGVSVLELDTWDDMPSQLSSAVICILSGVDDDMEFEIYNSECKEFVRDLDRYSSQELSKLSSRSPSLPRSPELLPLKFCQQ